MLNNISLTIIGAGSYGTALAIRVSRNGNVVLLWGRSVKRIQELKIHRCNYTVLPNIVFPPTLQLESSLRKAVSISKNILIAVPSTVFRLMLEKIKPYLKEDTKIIWVTKGLEKKTGKFLKDVIHEVLGNNVALAMISGPTFAKEMAKDLPISISIVSNDYNLIQDIKFLFQYKTKTQIYHHNDFIGIQLSSTIKNIISIGVGISDGIGLGANSRAKIITYGLKEMLNLGTAMGANIDTFMNIEGIGDLIITCTDDISRNRRFGLLLGKGNTIEESKNIIGQTVEGFNNIKELLILSKKFNIKMTIVEKIYEVLFLKKNYYQAILEIINFY